MRKKLCSMLLFFLGSSISLTAQSSFCLQLSVYGDGSFPGDTVFLCRYSPDAGKPEVRDTAILDKNYQAVFRGNYEFPEYAYLDIPGKVKTGFFMMDATQLEAYAVVLKGAPNALNPGGYFYLRDKNIIVEGGRENILLDQYRAINRMYTIRATDKHDKAEQNQVITEFMCRHPDSRALLRAFYLERNRFSVEELKTVLSAYEKMSGDEQYIQLQDYYDIEEKLTVGRQLPDFSLPSVDGRNISLSDLRGKYVLLDFWASWCIPCMHELPHVKKTGELLAARGLQIVSISIDRKTNDWLKAIEEKQMGMFLNLHDKKKEILQGVLNQTAIPFILLLDPEGRILARDLRGADIYNVPLKYINHE